MTEPIQMLLAIHWRKDGTLDRFVRYGEVTMHVGDLLEPPLTHQEMQAIAYAAKMAFGKVCRARVRLHRQQAKL